MVSCGQQKIALETLPRWFRLGSVSTRPTEREISAVSMRRGREVPLFARSLGWLCAILQQSQVRVGASLRMHMPRSLSRKGVRQTSIKLNFSDPDAGCDHQCDQLLCPRTHLTAQPGKSSSCMLPSLPPTPLTLLEILAAQSLKTIRVPAPRSLRPRSQMHSVDEAQLARKRCHGLVHKESGAGDYR